MRSPHKFRHTPRRWAIIRNRETLAVPAGADTARDIELGANDVVIERTARRKKLLIPRQPADIRHSAVQIERAHRVSDCLPLLPHGHVRLIVGAVHVRIDLLRPLTALIQKVLGKHKILLLARMLIQTHERKLDLRMPARRKSCIPAHIESLENVIGIPAHCRKEIGIDAALVKRDCRFDEMPCTVKFVLGPLHKDLIRLVDLIKTVEIPARKLIFHNGPHGLVYDRPHILIRIVRLKISCCFQPLGNVRIIEDMRRFLPSFTANRIKAPRLFKSAINVFQRDRRIQSPYSLPEALFERDALIIDRFHKLALLSCRLILL